MVPSGYWKIIAIKQNNSARSAAFIFSQSAQRNDDYCHFNATNDEIESRRGLEFFHQLQAADQVPIEGEQGDWFAELDCQ